MAVMYHKDANSPFYCSVCCKEHLNLIKDGGFDIKKSQEPIEDVMALSVYFISRLIFQTPYSVEIRR